MSRDLDTGDEPTDLQLWFGSHCKDGHWSTDAAREVFYGTYQRITDAPVVQSEEENLIFQRTYKDATGCKTSRTFCRGYLAKYPSRSELLNEQLHEQARAAAAATNRNNQLEDEVEGLKEHLAHEAAEREREKEESRQLVEDRLEATRNEMRKDFLVMLAQQTPIATQNTNDTADILNKQAITKNTAINVHKCCCCNPNKG
ncbi:hypothetical protein ACP4OV_001432 [Aristida adscensionis]